MKGLAALGLLVLLTLGSAGSAAAMRCGQQLVHIGDRKAEVLRKCGEPEAMEERQEQRFFRVIQDQRLFEVLEEVTVEEWTYNLGPEQFIRILRFENGRLERIETGDYGE